MEEKREAKLTGVVLPSVDLVALRRGSKAIVVLVPLIVAFALVDAFAATVGVEFSLGRCFCMVVVRLVAGAAVVRLRNAPGEGGSDPNCGDSIT